MTEDQRNDVLSMLDKGVLCTTGMVEFSEPGIVTEFRAFKDGEQVIIRIIDHGRQFDAQHFRYFCIATIEGDRRRKASGNGGATPTEALEGVQWHELDSANYPPLPAP